MKTITVNVRGIPYSRDKGRGDIEAPVVWSDAVKSQTAHLPRVKNTCTIRVHFRLPLANRAPNFPYGNDIDNLLKRLFDAMNKTVFVDAQGKDSCVLGVNATKSWVEKSEDAGANIKITYA